MLPLGPAETLCNSKECILHDLICMSAPRALLLRCLYVKDQLQDSNLAHCQCLQATLALDVPRSEAEVELVLNSMQSNPLHQTTVPMSKIIIPERMLVTKE